MSSASAPRLRSLYRRLLRELPPPQPITSTPIASSSSTSTSSPPNTSTDASAENSNTYTRTPLHARIRSHFSSPSSTSAPPSTSVPNTTNANTNAIQQAEQYLTYIRAQRMYATLLERYNPGMDMGEEERVRLTARRVGMDLPDELTSPLPSSGSSSGSGGGKKD